MTIADHRLRRAAVRSAKNREWRYRADVRITLINTHSLRKIMYTVAQAVADPEGGQGAMAPETYDRLKKSYERLMSSRLSVLTMVIIKFVACSPSRKTMFSAILRRNSSAFDWATVSLECQTGQAYWRSGPGRITVQKQILKWAGECTKNMHFKTPKWTLGGLRLLQMGRTHPLPIPTSVYYRRLYPCAFGARLGPLNPDPGSAL